MAGNPWKAEASEAVYLSIDKDAFGREEVVTDWDQGTMTLEQLERAYCRILDSRRILGVDICGEADRDEFFSGQMSASDEQNDAAKQTNLRNASIRRSRLEGYKREREMEEATGFRRRPSGG